MRIPKKFTVGGQEINVEIVERLDGNRLGECCVARGHVAIARMFDQKNVAPPSGMLNTFFHELTHAILQTMDEQELNNNEKFVCCFASFLTEAMRSAEYESE